jgi:hypothetical protein
VNVGDTVYFRDKEGAHFGHLVTWNDTTAQVRVGGVGKTRNVPRSDVRPWPPPPPEEQMPTTRKAKRK